MKVKRYIAIPTIKKELIYKNEKTIITDPCSTNGASLRRFCLYRRIC